MNKKQQAPLFDGLRRYLAKGNTAFHTPGHRGGFGLPEFAEVDWLGLDLTELTDNEGADVQMWRQEAEKLAAEFFGADLSCFLANGATEGVLALCLSVGSPGEEIIVARDCHLSVVHGIILAGLRPVFIEPHWLNGRALPALPTLESLERGIAAAPNAKAVWVTHPSYAGIIGDLGPVAEAARRAGMLFLVDEAHGGYLNLCGLPRAEARDLADAWVQGTHKIMGSLTQTGLLHLRGERLDRKRLLSALAWVRSTSPSYLLLSSLDILRRRLSLTGRERFLQVAEWGHELRSDLSAADMDVLEEPLYGSYRLDPMKIVISWLKNGWTGYAAQRWLRENAHIQGEYADRDQAVFFLSPEQSKGDLERLADAALKLANLGQTRLNPSNPPPLGDGKMMITPREAGFLPSENVTLDEAPGRTAASTIAPYPPGIPLWVPGETITQSKTQWLKEFLQNGGAVVGQEPDGTVRAVKN